MNYDPSNPDPRVIYLSPDADDSEDRTWGESPEAVGENICPHCNRDENGNEPTKYIREDLAHPRYEDLEAFRRKELVADAETCNKQAALGRTRKQRNEAEQRAKTA